MKYYLVLVLCLCMGTAAQAQDFRIAKFQENMLDLTAARAAVKDRNGDVCAIIKFSVRDEKFQFEPNMGAVKTEKKVGETWLYVPPKTKRLTIRHPLLGILRDYVIPVSIEQKVVYEAEIEITSQDYLASLLETRTDTIRIEVKKDTVIYKDKERNLRVNLGAGFNVMSIMGPSACLGFSLRQHTVEGGVVIGMGKVQNVSLYQTDNGAFWGTYDYKALRVFGRYGYDIQATKALIVTPQVGGAVTNVNGSELRRSASGVALFSKASAVSATVGCRFSYCLGKALRVQLTPEYDLAVKKSEGFKTLEQTDSKIKSWASGINVNVGLALSL